MEFIKMTKEGNALVSDAGVERKAYFVTTGELLSPSNCAHCVLDRHDPCCREATCTPQARRLDGFSAEDGYFSWDKP